MFWWLGAAMVLLALVCVTRPLVRTANDGSKPAMRRWAFVLILAIPLASFMLYRQLGAPAILNAQPALQGKSHDVDAMLAALEKRLEEKPDDAEGWFVLGQSYLTLQRVTDAVAALKRAVDLSPEQARFLSHYAEAVALEDKGDLQGRAKALIADALELDPQDEKALELGGLAAYQRQEWAQAAYYWRHLLKRLAPGSEFYQDIEKALKEVRGKAEHASGLGERAQMEPPEKRGTPPGGPPGSSP